MKYKAFGENKLSCLGMGNMRLPMVPGSNGMVIDRKRAQEMVDYALESGVNYFDTAYVYQNGDSERFTGESLQDYARESYYLATKFYILANPDYKAVFEEQLSRLKTDYIDFYLIHCITDRNYQQYLDSGCIEYFLEQKAAGRIKNLGFSTHAGIKAMTTFADYHSWDFAQIQLNYFDWKYGIAKEEYEVLKERNIPIMVMEPVRGGRLATLSPEAQAILKEVQPDWSIASWALRWLKQFSQVKVVLSGMSNLEQLGENIATFSDDRGLTEAENTALMKACDAFKKEVSAPCTGCRYCCDDCPAQINIPAVIGVYNRFKTDGAQALEGLKTINSEGMPLDCIECGICSNHCPQDIDIPAIMVELNEAQN